MPSFSVWDQLMAGPGDTVRLYWFGLDPGVTRPSRETPRLQNPEMEPRDKAQKTPPLSCYLHLLTTTREPVLLPSAPPKPSAFL